jgi:hypothetical protein
MGANCDKRRIVGIARGAPFPSCCRPAEGFAARFLFLDCAIKKHDVFGFFGVKSRPGLCSNLGGDTRQLLKLFALSIEPLSNELNALVTIRAKAHSIGARVLRAL